MTQQLYLRACVKICISICICSFSHSHDQSTLVVAIPSYIDVLLGLYAVMCRMGPNYLSSNQTTRFDRKYSETPETFGLEKVKIQLERIEKGFRPTALDLLWLLPSVSILWCIAIVKLFSMLVYHREELGSSTIKRYGSSNILAFPLPHRF